jgi:hypothetical protein
VWQSHAPAALLSRMTGTHYTGGRVGFKAGVYGCGKSYPTGILSADSPAHSELLYRLCYRVLRKIKLSKISLELLTQTFSVHLSCCFTNKFKFLYPVYILRQADESMVLVLKVVR